MRDRSRAGLAAVAAASVLFGTTGIFVHYLGDLPLPTLLAYRYGLGAIGFAAAFLLVPRLRASILPRRDAWRHHVALGVLLVAVDVFFYTAIARVGVGLAAILLYTAPIFVALGSWAFLREPPTPRAWGGIVVGFAGVGLIVSPDVGGAALDPAILAGIASGVAWALWLLVSRAAGARGVPAEAQAAGAEFVSAAAAVPVAIVVAPVLLGGAAFASAAGLGLLAGATSLLLFARGLRFVDASRAAVVGYLEPATAVALGALLLGERYGLAEAAGSVLVLAGAALATSGGASRSAS